MIKKKIKFGRTVHVFSKKNCPDRAVFFGILSFLSFFPAKNEKK